MKLDKQVTSLKLSKKLRKLGVKQESLYGWRPMVPDSDGKQEWDLSSMRLQLLAEPKWYSAFTVAELGEMLPEDIKGVRFSSCKQDSHWDCMYSSDERAVDKTEASARAKMLIYLIENDLIDK